MIFIEYATFSDATIRDNFGAPEYSYHFVRKGFGRVLDRLGRRIPVGDPASEVDPIYREAKERGEGCIYLSFNPPQKTVLGLECPTLPVFAWEYGNIPYETWSENPRDDWRYVLSRTGMAVTLSEGAAEAVRGAMGQDFPVWSIPTPVFDTYAKGRRAAVGWREPFELPFEGGLAISAGDMDLDPFRPGQPRDAAIRMLRVLDSAAARPDAGVQKLKLEGVVYTAVLSPVDGRKNWRDLVSGFVWAFRRTPNATLLFKVAHAAMEDGAYPVLQHISTLGAFECRIVLVCGLLSSESYGALIDASSYAVNTSLGEGQCLPLVEYMSAGRPAVAPAHTAMQDYVTPDNSFVVDADEQPGIWPQDERLALRSRHHRISFAKLVKQFRESYRVAKDDPAGYTRRSEAAVEALRACCSEDVATERLERVLNTVLHTGAGRAA
jgi:glycosyltransferase involved in cell wall biosynthesis